jgi:hypothetical protein
MLRGDRRWGWFGCGRVGVPIDDGQTGFGEDLEAHVPALLGPLVGLLGQYGADEADDGGPVGEDPDDVGAATDLFVQSFL